MTTLVSPGGSRSVQEYFIGGGRDGMLERIIGDHDGVALTTEFDYDSTGHRSRIISPGGRVAEMRYNAAGQLEDLTPPAVDGGRSPIRTWFGDDGSPVRIERPRGTYTDTVITDPHVVDIFVRDILGNLVTENVAANTAEPRVWRQRVDHDGRPICATEPAGTIIDRRYDERGLLVRERCAPGTPDEAVTDFKYDRSGRLSHITNPAGWETDIGYDPWGRVSYIDLPSGARRKYVWGARDLLLESHRRRQPRAGAGLPTTVAGDLSIRRTWPADHDRETVIRRRSNNRCAAGDPLYLRRGRPRAPNRSAAHRDGDVRLRRPRAPDGRHRRARHYPRAPLQRRRRSRSGNRYRDRGRSIATILVDI